MGNFGTSSKNYFRVLIDTEYTLGKGLTRAPGYKLAVARIFRAHCWKVNLITGLQMVQKVVSRPDTRLGLCGAEWAGVQVEKKFPASNTPQMGYPLSWQSICRHSWTVQPSGPTDVGTMKYGEP